MGASQGRVVRTNAVTEWSPGEKMRPVSPNLQPAAAKPRRAAAGFAPLQDWASPAPYSRMTRRATVRAPNRRDDMRAPSTSHLDAVACAELIKAGEVSPQELVREAI